MCDQLVVDTNVMLHAEQRGQQRQAAAQQFLRSLLDSSVKLCVDQGFSENRTQNQSRIGHEYLERLRFGGIGYTVVAELAKRDRIKELPTATDAAVGKRIRQLVRNRRDRTFVAVAYNASDRLLVSHDYIDFQTKKRQVIRKEVGVLIVAADECVASCLCLGSDAS